MQENHNIMQANSCCNLSGLDNFCPHCGKSKSAIMQTNSFEQANDDFGYSDNNAENIENAESKPRHPLVIAYNVIDWIDFALVIAIIIYWINPNRFYPLPLAFVGILLGFVSLGVSISAIAVSSRAYIKKVGISKGRLIARCIFWGIWIPIDIVFLAFAFGAL